jgi:DNA repair protein RecO (recombination protein O)
LKINVQGFVLNHVKYSDNTRIIRFFTKQFGLVSALYNLSGKQKSTAYLEPYALLEGQLYYNSNKAIHRLSQPSLLNHLPAVLQHKMEVSAIRFFICDILSKLLQESHKEESLFEYLERFDKELNGEDKLALKPIDFLIQLTHLLGFIIPDPSQILPWDMVRHEFVHQRPIHENYIDADTIKLLRVYNENSSLLTKAERKMILNDLLVYFSYHYPAIGRIKSLSVVEEVLA